ncbi:MAG TPA: DUF1549 domain-containing protein, partial [Verrucomicrobiae bacterium]|nr:DUF1549 domain-containing protein [Verrucomicrobiae bacterium]
MMRGITTALAVLAALVVSARADVPVAAKVDYNRDIRPILSDHCYACHGPDQKARKGGLRLDLKEEAFKAAKSGAFAIIPHDTTKSELVRRVTTTDADDRMPPAKGGKPLSSAQIETLRRWVQQGAEWKGHWAYQKPERPPLPDVREKGWPRNPIDNFILGKLESNGMKPSPEADKNRLIRRVTFDLTGVPPKVEDVDAFLKDKGTNDYEKVVDRLLGSREYGERMAMFWLDLARYADTQGYHHDAHRDMYRWRDYVINSFNDNKPFDQFTIEQLAGDLLPNPTLEQKIATGFQRNEMTTSEGGAIPEEYLVKYVVGRVDTAARVWLGTSLACAECHDHKYDPISQKEYYQFFAYFNNIPESGLDGSPNPVPRVTIKTAEQEAKMAQLDKEVATLESLDKSLLEEAHAARDAAQKEWQDKLREKSVKTWRVLEPVGQSARSGATLTRQADNSLLASGANAPKESYEVTFHTDLQNITGVRLEAIPDDSLPGKKSGRGEKGDFLLTTFGVEARSTAPDKAPALNPTNGNWHALGPFPAASAKEAYDKKFGPEDGVDLKKTYADGKLKWEERAEWKDGEVHELSGTNSATYLFRTVALAEGRHVMISL